MQQMKDIYRVEERILITGKVVHGQKKGREIGFPTANVNANVEMVENRVYGVYASLKGK